MRFEDGCSPYSPPRVVPSRVSPRGSTRNHSTLLPKDLPPALWRYRKHFACASEDDFIAQLRVCSQRNDLPRHLFARAQYVISSSSVRRRRNGGTIGLIAKVFMQRILLCLSFACGSAGLSSRKSNSLRRSFRSIIYREHNYSETRPNEVVSSTTKSSIWADCRWLRKWHQSGRSFQRAPMSKFDHHLHPILKVMLTTSLSPAAAAPILSDKFSFLARTKPKLTLNARIFSKTL